MRLFCAMALMLAACDGGGGNDAGGGDAGMDVDSGGGGFDAGMMGGAITVSCTGSVSAFNAPGTDPFAGAIGSGDAVSIAFTFDPTVADSDASPSTGNYAFIGPPTNLRITIEDWTWASGASVDCVVRTANDDGLYGDNFEADCLGETATPSIGAGATADAYLLLRDDNGSASTWRSSDALPTGNWSGFNLGEAGLADAAAEWDLIATIDSCN